MTCWLVWWTILCVWTVNTISILAWTTKPTKPYKVPQARPIEPISSSSSKIAVESSSSSTTLLHDDDSHERSISRRSWMSHISTTLMTGGLLATTMTPLRSSAAVERNEMEHSTLAALSQPVANTQQPQQPQHDDDNGRPFVSAAFSKKEYTNSIVASRDTNISPLEVYETLSSQLNQRSVRGAVDTITQQPQPQPQSNRIRRALDVGAGAGVSTQVLYDQLGYTTIDAVDWSGDAWRINVIENGYCPSTVSFYELDDERFVEQWNAKKLDKYDVIAFNFAINEDKALYFSRNLLREDGLLLAPINTQQDYWLKQTYQLMDSSGRTVWSASDVGAWAVQFQPDVTQPTCAGIWCSPFNGFQRLSPSSSRTATATVR